MRRTLSRRTTLTLAVACLIFAGTLTPLLLLTRADSQTASPDQLKMMIQIAQGSKAYAQGVVGAASAHGLDAGTAQADLSAGDGLLATAQTDLSSGNNFPAGVLAAQAAMSDYTAAAQTASIALGNAGLTASVAVDAEATAIVGLNATVNVVASVAAQACATTVVSTSVASAFQQVCAKASAATANATADLKAAAAIVAAVRLSATASADFSQAVGLVSSARAQLSVAVDALANIATYTYASRGQAYVQSLNALVLSANATVKAEQANYAALTAVQAQFSAAAAAQATAVDSVIGSFSIINADISSVFTSTVAADASAAQSTAAQVNSNLTALLALLSGVPSSTALAASITAAEPSTTAYTSAVSAAGTQSAGFSSTSLAALSTYFGTLQADALDLQAKSASYTSAYARVQSNLSALINLLGGLAPPALRAFNVTLGVLGAKASSTASNLDAALHTEVAATGNLIVALNAGTQTIVSNSAAIQISQSIVTATSSAVSAESPFLDTTGSAEVRLVGSDVSGSAQSALSFTASAQAALSTTVGGFAPSFSSLTAAGASLKSQGSTALTAFAAAGVSVSADIKARVAALVAGESDISIAQQMFASLEVNAGVSVLARASAELQFASALRSSS